MRTNILCLSTIILFLFLPKEMLFSQTKAWYKIYSPSDSSFSSSVVTNSSFSFVTGKVKSDSTGWDIHTLRYTTFSGTQAGPYIYSTSRDEEPVKIVAEGDQFFYINAKKKNSSGNYDVLLLKYSVNGSLIWEREFAGPGNGDDIPCSMVFNVDDKRIYITASSYNGAMKKNDILIMKYDTSGNLLWTQYYNNSITGNSNDIPSGIAVNGIPRVYISGTSDDSDNVSSIVTLGYDSAGTLLFADRWRDTSGGRAVSTCITSQPNTSVATGGYFFNGSNYDYVTLRYDFNGVISWVRKFNGQGNGNDYLTDIKFDNLNDIIVTGCSYTGTVTGNDYATVKYFPNGDSGWVNLFNGNGSGTDSAVALTVDGFNCIFVTGKSRDTNGDYAFGSLLYNNSGFYHWIRYFQNPQFSGDNIPVAIVKYLFSNSFVVTGSTFSATQNSYTSLFYIGIIDGIRLVSDIFPQGFNLSQNFPNPFNPSTTIRFEIPKGSNGNSKYSLKIYNTLGEEVATLLNDNLSAGSYEYVFNISSLKNELSNGIYFYTLSGNNFRDTKRMVLIK